MDYIHEIKHVVARSARNIDTEVWIILHLFKKEIGEGALYT